MSERNNNGLNSTASMDEVGKDAEGAMGKGVKRKFDDADLSASSASTGETHRKQAAGAAVTGWAGGAFFGDSESKKRRKIEMGNNDISKFSEPGFPSLRNPFAGSAADRGRMKVHNDRGAGEGEERPIMLLASYLSQGFFGEDLASYTKMISRLIPGCPVYYVRGEADEQSSQSFAAFGRESFVSLADLSCILRKAGSSNYKRASDIIGQAYKFAGFALDVHETGGPDHQSPEKILQRTVKGTAYHVRDIYSKRGALAKPGYRLCCIFWEATPGYEEEETKARHAGLTSWLSSTSLKQLANAWNSNPKPKWDAAGKPMIERYFALETIALAPGQSPPEHLFNTVGRRPGTFEIHGSALESSKIGDPDAYANLQKALSNRTDNTLTMRELAFKAAMHAGDERDGTLPTFAVSVKLG